MILKQYPLASKYYINPYKDERCSKNCYLNGVKYNQDIPRYHLRVSVTHLNLIL